MTHFPPPLSLAHPPLWTRIHAWITSHRYTMALECTGETPKNTASICHLQHRWECVWTPSRCRSGVQKNESASYMISLKQTKQKKKPAEWAKLIESTVENFCLYKTLEAACENKNVQMFYGWDWLLSDSKTLKRRHMKLVLYVFARGKRERAKEKSIQMVTQRVYWLLALWDCFLFG